MSEFSCHKHAVYDKKCPKCIPEPPFMRIGDHGETVNPKTGERIPPPTTEYRKAPPGGYAWAVPSIAVLLMALGFQAGYRFPRDVELESTAPVQFNYEVTPDAAKYLIQKAFSGCPVPPAS